MPTSPSTRLGLIGPSGGDDLNQGDDIIRAMIANLDPKVVIFGQGTLASRPVSTPGTPGIAGRRYYDTDFGLEHVDTGTGWAIVGVPIGGYIDYAGDSANPCPELMQANGAAISRTTYATLFARIGTTYGSGNGSTTFNLPDTTGRVNVATGSGIARGSVGGSDTHTLTTAQIPGHAHSGPSHTHTGPSHTHTGPVHQHGLGSSDGGSGGNIQPQEVPGAVNGTTNPLTSADGGGLTGASGTGATGASGTDATGSAGGGLSHPNMQPYLGVYRLIRVL